MKALDAAYEVLKAAGEPLHYAVITKRLLEAGSWKTEGKTPAATVHSALVMDVKRKGSASRFRRVAEGTYALNVDQAPPTKPGVASTETAPPAGTLSLGDAAERVLQQNAGKKPMHYKEITEKAFAQGLITSQGKSPALNMYSAIWSEYKRATRLGEPPRFTKPREGYVGLTRWSIEGLDQGLAALIGKHNKEVTAKLHQRILAMPPSEFELLVSRLLGSVGFENVSVTPYAGDGGIDVRGTLVVGGVIRTRMAVQVKRWKGNVQSQDVQRVRGSLGAHEQGLIITTSDFSQGARAEASRSDATPVALMNGKQLVNLLIANDIGVRRASYDLIELGEEEEEA